MKNQIPIEQWLEMSDTDRNKLRRKWDPYLGEGYDLLEQLCDHFRIAYGEQQGIEKVMPGLHHGGTHVITVLITNDASVDLPPRYKGFPVITLRGKPQQ